MSYKNTKRQIFQPILLALILIVGIFIGYVVLPGKMGKKNPLVIYPQTNKIEAILNLIEEEYVDTVDTHALQEEMIPEMLKKLDPHTVYIPAKDLKNVNEELSSEFGGIGVQFNIHKDTVMVIAVIPGGPSEKVGILPGDRIVSVNDSSIAGNGIKNAVVLRLLRGEMGTGVKVGVIRRNLKEPIHFDITRGKIPMYSVDVSYMVTDEIGYIKVNRFAANTYSEFLTALAKLKASSSKKLIIDFRGNSGGYLEVAINLCNEFLHNGDMIVYTEGKSNPRQEVHANGKGTCQDTEIAVLVDEFSASASEIFAGAIQDNDRGIVVGRRTFGKGLVQNQIPLLDGSALRLTISRYYTPAGRCIQKPYDNGNEEYYKDIIERFQHGEFFNRDSISVNDSLAYKTKNGRTVYGGGGIMPDYFVPRDTTALTEYYYRVRENGLIYRFALEYTDNNRSIMEQFTKVEEVKRYLNEQPILKAFKSFASKEGVKLNRKQFKISEHLIDTEIKAYIARNIIDNDGFYPILGEVDEVLQNAVQQLEK
ncbi:putative CtpA-like serine protease [Saccharicrinis fermentans DSM 9555 = JCM 21142]|uniref:Putative CtpA-like serine protease n=2 Tax=Saccharicrinis fermentans TaxID=982 RepID=W7Y837_9BACT|nr:putative CtpA-like serine protease [Saccharicrinis fermentans DSM 9555 = JCM 21142]